MIRLSLMRFALVVVVFLLSAVALEDAGVSFANAHTPDISRNTRIESFSEAKKLMRQVYEGHSNPSTVTAGIAKAWWT